MEKIEFVSIKQENQTSMEKHEADSCVEVKHSHNMNIEDPLSFVAPAIKQEVKREEDNLHDDISIKVEVEDELLIPKNETNEDDSWNHLSYHESIQEGVTSFKCDICNKYFTEKPTLSKHLLIHRRGKSFKCVICNKAFTRKNSLSRHTLTHTMQKARKCDISNNTFSNTELLPCHMQIQRKCEDKTQHDDSENDDIHKPFGTSNEGQTRKEQPLKQGYRKHQRKPINITEQEEEDRVTEVLKLLKYCVKSSVDPYHTFGQHIANELRKYDPTTLSHVKNSINSIFFKADTGKYRQYNTKCFKQSYTEGRFCTSFASTSPSGYSSIKDKK